MLSPFKIPNTTVHEYVQFSQAFSYIIGEYSYSIIEVMIVAPFFFIGNKGFN